MFFQIIEYGISREFILILRYFANFFLFYLAYQTGKKVKEGNFYSIITGLTIYFLCYGGSYIIHTFRIFYMPSSFDYLLLWLAGSFLIVGMVLFIFFVELDKALHDPDKKSNKFSYKFTIIALLLFIITFPLSFFIMKNLLLIFISLIIPFLFTFVSFIKKFQVLEMVKRNRALQLWSIGTALASFPNFLYVPFIFALIDKWGLIINSFCVILGGLLITLGWKALPSLSELNWLRKIEQLFVIHLESSGLLYQYNFISTFNEIEGSLASTAIGGVDALLGQILKSGGHIKEIDHGNKKIFFRQGRVSASILITTGHSDEIWYRLEMFQSSFEKQFSGYLKKWSGETTSFSKTKNLIFKIFLS